MGRPGQILVNSYSSTCFFSLNNLYIETTSDWICEYCLSNAVWDGMQKLKLIMLHYAGQMPEDPEFITGQSLGLRLDTPGFRQTAVIGQFFHLLNQRQLLRLRQCSISLDHRGNQWLCMPRHLLILNGWVIETGRKISPYLGRERSSQWSLYLTHRDALSAAMWLLVISPVVLDIHIGGVWIPVCILPTMRECQIQELTVGAFDTRHNVAS